MKSMVGEMVSVVTLLTAYPKDEEAKLALAIIMPHISVTARALEAWTAAIYDQAGPALRNVRARYPDSTSSKFMNSLVSLDRVGSGAAATDAGASWSAASASPSPTSPVSSVAANPGSPPKALDSDGQPGPQAALDAGQPKTPLARTGSDSPSAESDDASVRTGADRQAAAWNSSGQPSGGVSSDSFNPNLGPAPAPIGQRPKTVGGSDGPQGPRPPGGNLGEPMHVSDAAVPGWKFLVGDLRPDTDAAAPSISGLSVVYQWSIGDQSGNRVGGCPIDHRLTND